jgi:hypothetical protein
MARSVAVSPVSQSIASTPKQRMEIQRHYLGIDCTTGQPIWDREGIKIIEKRR